MEIFLKHSDNMTTLFSFIIIGFFVIVFLWLAIVIYNFYKLEKFRENLSENMVVKVLINDIEFNAIILKVNENDIHNVYVFELNKNMSIHSSYIYKK